MECDVSSSSFGAVLHQGTRSVALNVPITVHHMKLTAYERELISIVHVVHHWRPYLWGRAFVIKTGHYSIKFLLDQRLSTILQHQWASKLLQFNFQVEYKRGTTNVMVDALSRRDTETAVVMAISSPLF
jgi:hypothetical protein